MSTPKKNLNKEIIALFSGQSSVLTIPKLYVEIAGSHSLALVLNQCVFWSNKSSLSDGWFHKKYSDWFDEIHIKERTLRRRFEKLSEKGWVKTKTKMVNGLNTMHFQPDMDKIIESIENLLNKNNPNRTTCPDGSDNDPETCPVGATIEQKSCIKSAPCGQNVRTEPDNLSVSTIYTDNNLQKKTHTPSPVGVEKQTSFGLTEMLKDNPYEIPEKVLEDWLIVRNGKRAKMTLTAWEQVLGNIGQLKEKGLDPLFCFKTAVARGWVGIEVRFYKEYLDELSKNKAVFNEQQIRQREFKAQEEKKLERAETKSIGDFIASAHKHVDLIDLRKKQEAERISLSMSVTEYHKYVINKTNNKGMQNHAI